MRNTDLNELVPLNKQIILFDGVCNLCDSFVQFVLRHDKEKQFVFASLQSSIGQHLLRKHNLENSLKTVVLINDGVTYLYSDVAMRVGVTLGGWMKITYLFYLVPKFFRDWIYNWIAANRYRIFGQQDQCIIPDVEWRDRFLDA